MTSPSTHTRPVLWLTIPVVICSLFAVSCTLALYGRASQLQDEGRYSEAISVMQKVLAMEEQKGLEHIGTAKALSRLAQLYYDTGAYAQAEPLYQRALAIVEKVQGPEHPDTATVLNNLAELYRATGAYAKAEPLHQRALAIKDKMLGPKHPNTAQSLDNLVGLRWASGDEVAALPLFERGQAIQNKNANRFLLAGSESRKQAYVQALRGTPSVLLSFSLVLSGHRAITLGFTSVVQTKGRVLDAMSDSIGHLRQSVKPSDRALLDEFTALAQQQSTLTHQGPGNLPADQYRRRLQELSSKQEQLETELSKRSVEFRQQVAPVTLAAVQAGIPQGTALVEWYRYHPFDPKANQQSHGASRTMWPMCSNLTGNRLWWMLAMQSRSTSLSMTSGPG